MKPKSKIRSFLLLALGAATLAISSASAQTDYFWDQNGATASTGGTGAWNTSDSFWRSGSATGTLGPWVNAGAAPFNTATFAGTAGTVTLGANVTVGGLTFNTTAYSVVPGGFGITFGTAGNINVSTGTTTISAPISGSAITKTGGGVLTLDGAANTFNGLNLGGGTLNVGTGATDRLGAAGSTVTVTANTTIENGTGAKAFDKNLAVNGGTTLTFVNGNSAYTFSGVVSGSGAIKVNDAGSVLSRTLTLSSASNTFTGAIDLTNNKATIAVNSLGDAVGAGNIKFGGNEAYFGMGAGTAAPITLDNRRIEFTAAGNTNRIGNANATASNSLTINTDLLVTGVASGSKTLQFEGTNTGNNAFNGAIANGGLTTLSITKANAGTWALGGTNSYTGTTTVSAGTLIVSGTGSTNTGAYTVTNATLRGTTANAFGDTTNIDIGGAGILQLRGDANTVFERTTGGVDYTTRITATGATINVDRNTVAGTNQTFTLGAHTITSVAATVNTTYSGANNTSLILGAVTDTTAASGTVQFTNSITGGGSLTLASFAGTRTGTPTLQFSGAGNTTVTGAISQTGTQALTYNGNGILTLGGTNSYTGTTAINAGILRVNGNSSAATGAVNVTGGSLGGNGGSLGGAVTVSSTGGINLRDGSIGNLTLDSTLNITGAAGANNLRFDMGNGTGISDSLIVAGATTVTTAGAAVVDLNWLGGTSGRTPGTYTLIGGTGALALADFNKFSLPITTAFGQTYALVHDTVSDGGTGNLQLTVTDVTAATPAAFWAGGGNNWSTTTNWRTSLDGGDSVAGAPDYQTNVTFFTTTPGAGNLTSNVLDVDFDINSLNFTNASGNVTIAGPGALTIEAAAVNGNTAGNGINSLKTTGTDTISARVALASSQTWTVAGGGTLAVSGAISDFGLARSLTKAGGGTLTLSTNPTYTGATILNGGTLDVSGQGANPLSNSSGLLFTGTSTFIPTGAQPNYNFPSTTINSSVTANFTPSASGNNTTWNMASLSGAGTFNITTSGSGAGKNVVFGDLSSFTGVLQHTQSGGSSMGFTTPTLNDTVASNIRFTGAAGSTGGNNFRFIFNGTTGLTLTNRAFELAYTGSSDFEIRNSSANNSAFIINSNLAVTATGAKTLRLTGANGTNTFGGQIDNGTSAVISLNKADGNTWSLTSANNSYTGGTTISAGTLVIGGAGRLGSGSYAGAISNAGALRYSSSADQTLSGIISGAGSLTKDTNTTSTLTLNTSTNSYSGATNVHAGTLTFAGSSSGTLGAITVGGTGTPVLNIQAGSYTQGAGGFFVGGGTGGAGIVNQTGGTVAWNNTGLQLLIGNGGFAGTYNLSGGSLTTLTGTNTRGVMIGTNSNSTNTFNLSGTGTLTVAGTSRLMIGRSDSTQINTTNLFSQTGGTATISDMTMGGTSGGAGSGNSATMTLTGGTFTASAFSLLSAANNDDSTITIGGTAYVTLPNLPTARGSNATATINFDGGTLRNSATGTFITGLTNAFIMDDGANFDTSLNSTTISQDLLTHGSSLGGGLIKIGANTLTLTGTNTYTGATNINDGTLLVNGNQPAAIGAVTVAANGTLGGIGTLGGATIVDGKLAPGNSGVGTLTFVTGGLTLGSLAPNSLQFELGAETTAGTTYDTVVTNTLDIGTLDFADFQFTDTGTLGAGVYTLISSGATITGSIGTASGTIGALNGTLSLSGNDLILTVTGGSVPTVTLTGAPIVAVDTTYGSPSPIPTSFTVSGTDLTEAPGNLTVAPPAGFEVSLSSDAGYTTSLSVPYTTATLSSTTVYLRLAGSAAVADSPYSGDISVSGGGLASPATIATVASTVTAKALTVTATGPLKSFGTALTAGTSTTDFIATGLVNGETVTGVTLTHDAAGLTDTTPAGSSYVVTPSLATGSNGFLASNYDITYVDYNGTVAKKVLSITAPALAARDYDATNTAGVLTIGTLSGLVGSETLTVTGVAADYPSANAGSYPGVAVTYTLSDGTGSATNYSLANDTTTGVINKLALAITAPVIAAKDYDGTTTAGAVTLGTLSGFVGSETVTATGTAADYSSSNVGTYPGVEVTYTLADGTGLAANYSLANGAATGVINPKALTVTATGPTKTYGTALTDGTSTTDFTATGLATGETVTGVTLTNDSAGLAATTLAGVSYVVTPSAATGSDGFLESNYAITYSPYTGEVAKKPLAITAPVIAAKDYDATVTAGELTLGTLSGLVEPETLAVTGVAADYPSANAGSYLGVVVTYTLADGTNGGSASNYSLANGAANGVINPKALSITAPVIADKTYNGSAAAGAVTVGTLSGFVGSETVAVTGVADDYPSANAGSYAGVVVIYTLADGTNGGSASNYSLANGAANGVINPKALSITAPVIADKTYNGSAAAGAVTVGTLSGLVGSETVTATGVAADYPSANAGSYPGVVVTYTLADGTNNGFAANYSLANGTADGVINPKALSITAPVIADKTYNGSAAAGAVTVGTLSGLVGSETVTVTGVADDYPSANAGSYAGVVVIYTLADGTNGGSASNYSLANGSATGVINKADQTISFTLASPVLLSAETVSLLATSTSGLPVTFTSSHPTIADVSGSTLNLNEGGTITVTASQAGDSNYNAATDVSHSLTITDDSTPPTLAMLRVVSAAAYNSGTDSTSVTVEFTGEPNKTYQIAYSTDLVTWSAPTEYSTGATGTFQATFTKAGNVAADWKARLFFRATN